ncbi:MAG: membrane protein insertase YidC, partial [Bacteroidota bacterium]|nr:membrane protein insertase YidC [Bacteroidota bacterium]
MGKQETIGFVLIAAVLMAWMYFSSPSRQPIQDKNVSPKEFVKDSAQRKTQAPVVAQEQKPVQSTESAAAKDSLGKYFAGKDVGAEQVFTIETQNYIAELSTKGGVIKKWTLKNYKTWDQHPVQLVNGEGDFSILFSTSDGKLINTKGLFFTAQIPIGGKVILSKDEQFSVNFVLNAGEGKIVKKLTFKNTAYDFDAELSLSGLQNVIANYEYQVLWENSIRYCEYNSVDESNSAAAYSFGGGELKEVNASSNGEVPKAEPSGSTDWVALRNKYFAVALISQDNKASGAYLEGHHILAENQGVVEQYSVALKYPYRDSRDENSKISIFIGPLDFSIIKGYDRGLDHIMSLGWSWIRPITEYIFIPLFNLLHSVISNYGLVIILFSIIIKLALHPLTKTSMRSMRNMQKLQPMMAEMKEKYKSDPQQMNIQTMKLYKDYGINPAGGCLPLLIQLPILYALYSLFTATIQLRHAPFVGWITDLSVPDVLVTLPFTLP